MNDGHSSSPSCLLPSVCNAETHKPMSERKVTWPTFTCDWTLSWTKSTHSVLALALGRACVSGVLAVSSVTRQHRGSRFHSWFGAQGAAKTLVWNRILLRNPTQSRARARGKMDLYIIKHPPTHTHTRAAAPLHLQHSTGHTGIPYRVSHSLYLETKTPALAPFFTYGNSLSSEHLHSIPYLVSHGSGVHPRE